MSAPAPVASAVMPAPFTHPQSVPLFNGPGDIGSWFKRLTRDYRHANGNTDPSPSSMIQALDSAIVGDAATFVSNNPLLSQIVEQADASPPRRVWLSFGAPFRTTMASRQMSQPPTMVRSLISCRVMASRWTRTTPVYLQAFAEEAEETSRRDLEQAPPHAVGGFKRLDIRFLTLLAEAIDQGALSSDSLRSALHAVKKASNRLEVKSNVARQMAKQARLGLIDG
ncbi:hypothetical protein E4U32_000937 [Claviceps aff. humidiphila group G2b]|nr:hypothetical protein E4U32_000937 [Claviceps aff. humidiphila group G2b]